MLAIVYQSDQKVWVIGGAQTFSIAWLPEEEALEEHFANKAKQNS